MAIETVHSTSPGDAVDRGDDVNGTPGIVPSGVPQSDIIGQVRQDGHNHETLQGVGDLA